ncbi:MAG TPA: hypothetical protein VJV03_18750 [Pyrinomonadaceae bacterium]|nr:hypothetical protein [Pyrinomonadaceae bacterium]
MKSVPPAVAGGSRSGKTHPLPQVVLTTNLKLEPEKRPNITLKTFGEGVSAIPAR